MKKKNLLLWGYYGANNFGDDLIFESLIQILDLHSQKFNLFYTIKNKEYKYNLDAQPLIFFDKKHKNKRINFLLNTWFVLKTAFKMDIIIIGGGTQYFELYTRKPISIAIKYMVCCIMKLRGKKFINAGVGIGEVHSKIGLFCLKNIFSKASYSFVRDQQSKNFLIRIGVPENKVILGEDLSYYAPIFSQNDSLKNPKKIGLNFFDYFNYIIHDNEKNEHFIKDLKNFVQWLKHEKGLEPHFFAFQKETGGKDYLFIKEHFSTIDAPIHIYQSNINDFIHLIKSMDLNVGMRYHFAVLSLQHQIPFVGLNYQPKVRRELVHFGLEDFVLEMEETPLLHEKLDNMLCSFEEHKERIKNHFNQNNNPIKHSPVEQLLDSIDG